MDIKFKSIIGKHILVGIIYFNKNDKRKYKNGIRSMEIWNQ